MAALLLHGQHARVGELGEMPARCLGAHAGMPGQFARRQRAAAHQGQQHVGARGVADQGRDFGERIA
jgi:hypothetical protein